MSALPGVGDAIGVFAKGGKACKIVTAFHKAGAAGNMLIGAYTLGNIGAKYMFGDGDFTAGEVLQDLFTVTMTGASMWGSAKDFGTSYCFVAGTLVTTEDGFKPIEEIEVGDKVLSENELTGEVAVKTVTETYVNETDELVHIGVNGETISATPSHPFYVYQFGWTLAGSLRAGDVLVLSNGELVTVEWIDHEILESPIKVYNFEVEDFHTYFVGESSVLVHNDCTEFYTVQNNVDAERLRNGGVPWPNEPTRAALGEGVYAWGTLDEAEGYLAKIQKRDPSAQILSFTIDNDNLNNLRSIDIDKLSDIEADTFMNQYSRLFGGTPNHGYEHIQRGTNIGVEHYFSSSIFDMLSFG